MDIGTVVMASHGRVGRLVGTFTPPDGAKRYVLQGDATGHPLGMQVVLERDCEEADHAQLVDRMAHEMIVVVHRCEYLGLKHEDVQALLDLALAAQKASKAG